MKKGFIVLLVLLFLPILSFAQDDEPISLTATTSHMSPFVGQRFRITASVINTAYESISGSLLVKGASGLTFFDPDAPIGTSNQWVSGEQILSGKGGQIQIKFDAEGNEQIEAPIEIIFNYQYKGEEKKTKTSLNINVREPQCGDGKCEHTETSDNCCEDCKCSNSYECEKHGSDVKPRCYHKSKIKAFFDNLFGYAILFIFIILGLGYALKKMRS